MFSQRSTPFKSDAMFVSSSPPLTSLVTFAPLCTLATPSPFLMRWTTLEHQQLSWGHHRWTMSKGAFIHSWHKNLGHARMVVCKPWSSLTCHLEFPSRSCRNFDAKIVRLRISRSNPINLPNTLLLMRSLALFTLTYADVCQKNVERCCYLHTINNIVTKFTWILPLKTL